MKPILNHTNTFFKLLCLSIEIFNRKLIGFILLSPRMIYIFLIMFYCLLFWKFLDAHGQAIVCFFLCFSEDDMHYNYEADLMLDSVNRRYKKIVLTTYLIGMAMAVVGCILVLYWIEYMLLFVFKKI